MSVEPSQHQAESGFENIVPQGPHLPGPSPLAHARLGEVSAQLLEEFKRAQGVNQPIASQRLLYADFLKEVLANPRHMVRNVFQYTADAMESFGVETRTILGREVQTFALQSWPWESDRVSERRTLAGQELALNEFYQQMKLFGRREYANRMFVFHGPPGSGKTRLNDTLDAMVEHFSERDPRGALYRLVWVFANDSGAKKIGFRANLRHSAEVVEDPSDPGQSIIYRPTTNTDPIFLLSAPCFGANSRERLVEQLQSQGNLPADFNFDYFLRGQLDTFSEAVLDALLDFYHREHTRRSEDKAPLTPGEILDEVLKHHVRVERWTLSRRQGRGLCSIWANPSRDADIEPLWNTFAPPPHEIKSAERELYMPTSFMIRANRGHYHLSDLFRPDMRDRGGQDISHLNHLLNEIESGATQIISQRQAASAKTEHVNVLLRADANDDLIAMKTTAQGWSSLARRLHFIPVPHITRFLAEESAHKEFFRTIVGPDRFICPHVLRTLSLFVTATRLLRPKPDFYEGVHRDLPVIVDQMSVVEKALLFQEPINGERAELNMLKPDEQARWRQDEVSIIQKFLPEIAREYMTGYGGANLSLYDGAFGISTASAQDLLRTIAVFRPEVPISVLEVIEVLKNQGEGFSYYDEIQVAKQRQAQRALEEKKRDAHRRGQPLKQNEIPGVLRKIMDAIEDEYPIPSPETIIRDVEVFARRKIQDDFYGALGVAGEQPIVCSLRRYLAHARVSIGHAPLEVEPEHRVTDRERGHNAKLLEEFEDRVVKNEDISSDDKRLEFRRHLFEQIGNWQAAHPERNATDHYEAIFGELVEGIRAVRNESLERPLRDFQQLCTEYASDPLLILRHIEGNEDERRRAKRWIAAIQALENKFGYPKEEKWDTIRKHLEWAMNR